MTDRDPRHDPCAWADGTAEPGRPDAVLPRPDGGLVVRAHCPRCHGPTVKRIPRILPGDKGVDEAEQPGDTAKGAGSEQAWVLFFCECGRPHLGRPPAEGRYGCGTSWWVSR